MRVTLTLAQLACDHDGCTTVWPAEPVAGLNRRAARRAGWAADGNWDSCPEHSERTALIARLRRLSAAGLTDGQIGERVGLSRGTIQGLRSQHGIAGRRPGRPGAFR